MPTKIQPSPQGLEPLAAIKLIKEAKCPGNEVYRKHIYQPENRRLLSILSLFNKKSLSHHVITRPDWTSN